eukprot:TRINITY_DN360_c0_g1_i4.p1 TRINITY_DN360_c0_g1~~TRINITY_DN360_c0_g1_i4.p1  ORF type:complete len:106 (-),score=10.80 TRINITY_DN360_c0_g1_i4:65-382(-)
MMLGWNSNACVSASTPGCVWSERMCVKRAERNGLFYSFFMIYFIFLSKGLSVCKVRLRANACMQKVDVCTCVHVCILITRTLDFLYLLKTLQHEQGIIFKLLSEC